MSPRIPTAAATLLHAPAFASTAPRTVSSVESDSAHEYKIEKQLLSVDSCLQRLICVTRLTEAAWSQPGSHPAHLQSQRPSGGYLRISPEGPPSAHRGWLQLTRTACETDNSRKSQSEDQQYSCGRETAVKA
jgi:hypothetical protein